MVPSSRPGQLGLLHPFGVVSGRWWYGEDTPHLGSMPFLAVLCTTDGTEQARLVKTVKVQGWVAQAHLDQTVGCNTREGGPCLVNLQGCDRYRLGHRPVFSFLFEKAQCTVRPT